MEYMPNSSSTFPSALDCEGHNVQSNSSSVPDPRVPSTTHTAAASVLVDRLKDTEDRDTMNENSDTDEGEHPDALANALEATSFNAKAGTIFYSGK